LAGKGQEAFRMAEGERSRQASGIGEDKGGAGKHGCFLSRRRKRPGL